MFYPVLKFCRDSLAHFHTDPVSGMLGTRRANFRRGNGAMKGLETARWLETNIFSKRCEKGIKLNVEPVTTSIWSGAGCEGRLDATPCGGIADSVKTIFDLEASECQLTFTEIFVAERWSA